MAAAASDVASTLTSTVASMFGVDALAQATTARIEQLQLSSELASGYAPAALYMRVLHIGNYMFNQGRCHRPVIWLGVQMPRRNPPWSMKACCTGCNRPSSRARSSMVVISAPSTAAVRVMQEAAISPSTRTVHAPQIPTLQPSLVPVRSGIVERYQQREFGFELALSFPGMMAIAISCWSFWPLTLGKGTVLNGGRSPEYPSMPVVPAVLITVGVRCLSLFQSWLRLWGMTM